MLQPCFSDGLELLKPLWALKPAGVTNDSRQVKPGFAFIAIPGAQIDGHDFIAQAIQNGAIAIVCSRDIPLPENICAVKVPDAYLAYALMCEHFYGFPASKFKLHCITGTNGKTTSAYLLREILSAVGHSCGLISTIKYAFGAYECEAARTTPAADELQLLFRQMADSGCTDVVMEASSHGLSQHRFGHPDIDIALFTNLTQDHLDYHLTMENYFQAKKTLFTDYNAKHKIVNIDDPYGARLAAEVPGVTTFGTSPDAHFRISDIGLNASGGTFRLNNEPIECHLPGAHNIYNLTGVLAAAERKGIPALKAAGFASNIRVDGRLEHFEINGAHFYVDYAHTPDALESVLKLLKKIVSGRLITVFGCGGHRDRGKRPLMGEIAARLSDLVIVTSDNPRDEDPADIINDILKGCPDAMTEPDRGKAIEQAVKLSRPADIILIAGKGHENYQESNGLKIHFDDREELRKYI